MPNITKQDALRWLDMQRDAVNTEIAYAAPDEKKQYHENLKIINWLAEAARVYSGEMTAVEYLKALNEECSKHEGVCSVGNHPCRKCPFDGSCIYGDEVDPTVSVEIVKKWKEEQDGSAQTRG